MCVCCDLTKQFINNNGVDPHQSDNPQVAVVSFKGDRGTSYDMYIQVYNELRGATTTFGTKPPNGNSARSSQN